MSPARSDKEGRLRFPGVRAPKPLLSAEAERRLSPRQLDVLDELETRITQERLGDLTMAQLASELNCSLRTLYGIAPSKDELLLTVVDRRLHRIGRAAIESLDVSMSPLALLRAYLRAANQAVQPESASLSRHLADVPGAKRLLDAHENYVIAVTRSLLDQAALEKEIPALDSAALAHVLGGLGREFARPELAAIAGAGAKATADAIAEIILRGLTSTEG